MKPAKGLYGQLVVGPPGSGKTTYCHRMAELLRKCGRKVVTVNLDPANDAPPFKPDIDVKELVDAEDVMAELGLGPNGALVHCVEYLEKNLDWLRAEIEKRGEKCYFLFDAPGQVELYTHHPSLRNIFESLGARSQIRICTVHLVDSHHCSDAGKFLSALTVSLLAMLRIGLPHVNALSKIDLLRKHSERLQFGLDFYTDVLDLQYLVETLDDDPFAGKYKKLNGALASVIEDYSLVSFALLDSGDEESLTKIKGMCDRANGFGFDCDKERSIDSMLSCALGMQGGADERDRYTS